MEELRYDIAVVGMGLGAAALVHRLRDLDARIVMVPGVGCARFKHLDGGIIAPGQLESAFGTSAGAPLHAAGDTFTFRRDQLEVWAINQVRNRVDILDDFADRRVAPHESGGISLDEEAGKRAIVAGLIVLTEGASPKIGIEARIRQDFEPEDLLHFGRTLLPGAGIATPLFGEWRTSWDMPGWYSAVPHSEGVIVSASARIENIMRAGRDGRDALRDFLQSPVAARLGMATTAAEIGMELVPLSPGRERIAVGTHRMIITPDANGTIDPRSPERFAGVLASGSMLGDYIARRWPHTSEWAEARTHLSVIFTTHRTPYHDSSRTGFIEEGAERPSARLRKILKR